MGNVSMVFSDGLVACMEVKSTLKRKDFFEQIIPMFRALPKPESGKQGPLKVIFAVQLESSSQHRHLVEKWANDGIKEKILTPDCLPDIVIILDNAAIIKGGSLECLKNTTHFGNEIGEFYKFGNYHTQKWAGLMLLVFELAQRAGGADWSPYIQPVLNNKEDAIEFKILTEK